MHKDRQMSEKEMRMLAQKPEISLSGIASGRFMEPVSYTHLYRIPSGRSHAHHRPDYEWNP